PRRTKWWIASPWAACGIATDKKTMDAMALRVTLSDSILLFMTLPLRVVHVRWRSLRNGRINSRTPQSRVDPAGVARRASRRAQATDRGVCKVRTGANADSLRVRPAASSGALRWKRPPFGGRREVTIHDRGGSGVRRRAV